MNYGKKVALILITTAADHFSKEIATNAIYNMTSLDSRNNGKIQASYKEQ